MHRILFSRILPIAIIFLISLPKRIIFPMHGLFAFNYDQGRDFLTVSQLIVTKHLPFIGQTTGLSGVFYGPWWYYFLAFPILIFGGDPQKVAILFAFIGAGTTVATYLLLKSITNNQLISFSLSIVAAIANFWMWGPTHIWNPSLTPIFLILFIYSLKKISQKSSKIFFFLLGASALLAADTTASFGFVLILFLIISPFILKRELLKKNYLFTVLGALTILSPRILFDVKNNFLISRSALAFLTHPSEGQSLPLLNRLFERLSQFFKLFAQAFTRENNILAMLLLIFVAVVLLKIVTNQAAAKNLRYDSVTLYLLSLLFASFIFFVIFPNAVWEYYLVGLPIIFIVIIAKTLNIAVQNNLLKLPIYLLLIFLPVLNFRTSLLPPYTVTWEGDGGTYINEKKVVDYIASQHPTNYSLFAYSPAIFDYPFDYLTSWYVKRGLIESPQKNQKTMFLIIRESSNDQYIKNGWYLDKTHDRTEVLERIEFPGDLVVEKHLVNESNKSNRF